MLGQSKIIELLGSVIENGDLSRVGQISYDLATKAFYTQGGDETETYFLMPGDSVFIGSEEIINLPDNLCCRVTLRNSRLRQGLSLDAPVYFPTHHTRVFFRVTNISADMIKLDRKKGIAAITFESVVGNIEDCYKGAFVDEFDFNGLGDYKDIYKNDLEKIEKKADEIENMEKRLYGNVMTLMAIFVSVFTLVNVNLVSGIAGLSAAALLALNLASVGSLLALFAAISAILQKSRCLVFWLVVLSAVAFLSSSLVVFFLGA